MGIFRDREEMIPPHPRKEPRLEGGLTPERVEEVFGGSIDFARREFLLGNDPKKRVELCYVMGQLRVERANDYVLRPLCENPALAAAPSLDEAYLPQSKAATCRQAGFLNGPRLRKSGQVSAHPCPPWRTSGAPDGFCLHEWSPTVLPFPRWL